MKSTIGQKLLEAATNATKEAVLVSPFVKVDALRRVLEQIPVGTAVTVISRWIPGEILAGVCDLEIYDLIDARPNAELFVHPLLHAKSYRFDENVFIGSANLTSKALGWAYPSNLEILEPAGEQSSIIREFERHLVSTSTKVDVAYRDQMAKQIELLGEQPTHEIFFEAHLPKQTENWLPKCRDPRRLWLVYSEPQVALRRMVESAYAAAIDDLAFLGPPLGLSFKEFREWIVAILESLPIVNEVAIRATKGLLETDAISLVEAHRELNLAGYGPADQWEILREWLLGFPDVYRRDTHPESFRVSTILR